mmetsp:Transcript_36774/g.108431  ORF Transcript_36774/g.108431 Transcript_36774/m.108431 type:complete len:375 (+) Transcript_36774:455-1579(+)
MRSIRGSRRTCTRGAGAPAAARAAAPRLRIAHSLPRTCTRTATCRRGRSTTPRCCTATATCSSLASTARSSPTCASLTRSRRASSSAAPAGVRYTRWCLKNSCRQLATARYSCCAPAAACRCTAAARTCTRCCTARRCSRSAPTRTAMGRSGSASSPRRAATACCRATLSSACTSRCLGSCWASSGCTARLNSTARRPRSLRSPQTCPRAAPGRSIWQMIVKRLRSTGSSSSSKGLLQGSPMCTRRPGRRALKRTIHKCRSNCTSSGSGISRGRRRRSSSRGRHHSSWVRKSSGGGRSRPVRASRRGAKRSAAPVSCRAARERVRPPGSTPGHHGRSLPPTRSASLCCRRLKPLPAPCCRRLKRPHTSPARTAA